MPDWYMTYEGPSDFFKDPTSGLTWAKGETIEVSSDVKDRLVPGDIEKRDPRLRGPNQRRRTEHDARFSAVPGETGVTGRDEQVASTLSPRKRSDSTSEGGRRTAQEPKE